MYNYSFEVWLDNDEKVECLIIANTRKTALLECVIHVSDQHDSSNNPIKSIKLIDISVNQR